MAPVGRTSSSEGIPSGQYKVVTIALDLTGKKLIDEICHIAAYYQDPEIKTYSQYVMPHREVSRSSIRTHGIRIVTNFGRFRVLKEARGMKTLRTKSEYSTLCEFMDWLKEVKGSTDGVLLAFHDNNRDHVTPFLMDAIIKYKLADQFFETVSGFVNVCKYAEKHEETKERSVALRALCRRLLTNDDFKDKNNMSPLQSAKDRARFIYQIMLKLAKSDNEVSPIPELLECGTTRDDETKNLEFQRELTAKVRTLKPIFSEQISKGPKERTRAVVLRRYLIEGAIDYECLKKAYEVEDKAGVQNVVSKTPAKKKEKDMDDLVDMIYTHFKTGGIKKAQNGNVKEIGQGEPGGNGVENGVSASSSETDDEEFEEAHEDEEK